MSKSKNKTTNRRQAVSRRDINFNIANSPLPSPPPLLHRNEFNVIQDLRTSHPRPVSRAFLSTSGFTVTPRRVIRPNFSQIELLPRRALLCARRKIRKEVLFARGRAGAGNKKPKFRQNSKYRCS